MFKKNERKCGKNDIQYSKILTNHNTHVENAYSALILIIFSFDTRC